MGNERLFPPGEVDPIPKWIYELVVRPIVRAGIISDEEYINSVVINDYEPKGEERARAREFTGSSQCTFVINVEPLLSFLQKKRLSPVTGVSQSLYRRTVKTPLTAIAIIY